MERTTESITAAPPDDGHLGSWTTPEDVMQVAVSEEEPRSPALNVDPSRGPSGEGAGGWTWVWLTVFVVVATAILGHVYL